MKLSSRGQTAFAILTMVLGSGAFASPGNEAKQQEPDINCRFGVLEGFELEKEAEKSDATVSDSAPAVRISCDTST